MKALIVAVGLGIASGAGAVEGSPQSDPNGTICLAPVKADVDPRSYTSEQFGVRIDNGAWTAVPAETPALIDGIALSERHLITIRDGAKTIQSFWFRFDQFDSRDLCLWYKPWYRTWSLWEAAVAGQKCRCRPSARVFAG